MTNASKMVGKRIKEILICKSQDGVQSRVFLVFTGGYYCELASDSAINMNVASILNPEFSDRVRDKQFVKVEEAVFDEDGSYKKQVDAIFHRLWSKAEGPKYDKAEWKALGSLLEDL